MIFVIIYSNKYHVSKYDKTPEYDMYHYCCQESLILLHQQNSTGYVKL